MPKFLDLLLKYAESHPEQILAIIQQILDILKANPALLPEVVAALKSK